MIASWSPLRFLTGMTILVGAVVLGGSSPAVACSCIETGPIEAVGLADVVFTGKLVGFEGTEFEPVWRFDVDGVVKGDVNSAEIVTGSGWSAACGTDFDRFNQSVVVYAKRTGEGLAALDCMPTPTAADFADRIAVYARTSRVGLPVAVLSGAVGTSDIAVLDDRGRTLVRGNIGRTGSVVHCPGTTLAAVVSQLGTSTISIVDLKDLSVVEERIIKSGYLAVERDRLACLNGGRRIVTSAGYGPDEGVATVATSNASDSGIENQNRSYEGISRAVLHPAGTVLLLPTAIGESVRTVSSVDLEPIADGEFGLPAGASVLDGDVSPDGSQVAMLVTLSGLPVMYDTGATHVVTFALVDGLPVPGTESTLALVSPGASIKTNEGAAKWIRWFDDSTWIIERETTSTKRIEIVGTDGTQVLAATDVGWGWGLSPISTGVLRSRNGGVELLDLEGSTTPGDPAPLDDLGGRHLSISGLSRAPDFSTVAEPIDPLTITPLTLDDASGPELTTIGTARPSSSSTPDEVITAVTEVTAKDPGANEREESPPRSQTPSSDTDGRPLIWLFAAAVALVVSGALVISRGMRRS